ncbi:MAG: carbohydrate kinase, partial [Paramuribaculum sp.]|nr:carbohydrate kinase [Paramuribaculum sp.]
MESQHTEYAVGIGEVLWDMLPEGKKLGGAPANFSYHVSQFGLPGCVVSAVGNDALGEEITDNILDKDLDFSIDKVPYPTG